MSLYCIYFWIYCVLPRICELPIPTHLYDWVSADDGRQRGGRYPHQSKSQWGSTALIYAAQNGHIDCVQVLVESGADMGTKNDVRGMIWFQAFFNLIIIAFNHQQMIIRI